MLFQETPDSFNRIVLAMIRRVVGQLQSKCELVGKVDNTIHELSASAMVLRPVVLIDNKRGDDRKALTDLIAVNTSRQRPTTHGGQVATQRSIEGTWSETSEVWFVKLLNR